VNSRVFGQNICLECWKLERDNKIKVIWVSHSIKGTTVYQ